jgi:hypothetical protein
MVKILSQKKLEAGDAQWAHIEEILGFVFDGKGRTVHLTHRKAPGIAEAAARLLKKNRAPVHKFQSVIGKMKHVTTILPAARGMFTPLNQALRGASTVIALSANGEVRAALLDLRQLVLKLADRPTHAMTLPASAHTRCAHWVLWPCGSPGNHEDGTVADPNVPHLNPLSDSRLNHRYLTKDGAFCQFPQCGWVV